MKAVSHNQSVVGCCDQFLLKACNRHLHMQCAWSVMRGVSPSVTLQCERSVADTGVSVLDLMEKAAVVAA